MRRWRPNSPRAMIVSISFFIIFPAIALGGCNDEPSTSTHPATVTGDAGAVVDATSGLDVSPPSQSDEGGADAGAGPDATAASPDADAAGPDAGSKEEVFIAGGYDLMGHYSADVDVFMVARGVADASAELTLAPRGQLLQARIEYGAAVLGDGRILVAGGSVAHETNDSGLLAAELYNPVSGTSVATTHPMTVARAGLTATLLGNGKVLLVGGNDANGNPLASAELYDPATDTFTATHGAMSCARFGHDATLLADARVLITGGWSLPPTATSLNLCTSADVYDPALDAFVQTAAPTTGRVYHTATLLASGKVLVAGGATSTAPTNSATAEIFDPGTMSFLATSVPMTTARAGHAATLLESAKVLLTSGIPGENDAGTAAIFAQTAEIYDPIADSFALCAGPMVQTRAGQAQVLLHDGKVLIMGGGTGDGTVISDTSEIYDPLSDSFVASAPMSTTRGLVPAFDLTL
jgi:Galactose oxidase, central domain